MSNKRVSAVIINEGMVLLIHRIKNGKEYYVLPGGSVENGEDNERALRREVGEETGLDIEMEKELWQIEDAFDRRKQFVYLITKYSGETSLGGPEKERQSEKNQYILEWHSVNKLSELLMYPEEIKEKLGSWRNID